MRTPTTTCSLTCIMDHQWAGSQSIDDIGTNTAATNLLQAVRYHTVKNKVTNDRDNGAGVAT
jgi:hypothetical protein